MKSVNVTKRSNIKCEHCAYYNKTDNLEGRGSQGLCVVNSKPRKVKYYQRCKKFTWSSNYLNVKTVADVLNVKRKSKHKHDFEVDESKIEYVCKRCGRPLTDEASIARGFGKSCYEQRLR